MHENFSSGSSVESERLGTHFCSAGVDFDPADSVGESGEPP